MQLLMKKYKQIGMTKKMKIFLHQKEMQQIIKIMMNVNNFQVLRNYVFKEERMGFRVTSLTDSAFAPRILPAIMWPGSQDRAGRGTSAPSLRGLRHQQRKILTRIL